MPLLGILTTLLAIGDHAQEILERGCQITEQRWPVVVAALLLLGGTAVTTIASVQLASS